MPFVLLLSAMVSRTDLLKCVTKPDRIEIGIPVEIDKRIGSLAVVHGGKWVVLVDARHHLAPFWPRIRRLVLSPVRQIGAYLAADGTERRVRAFARRGTYRIVFANNLETEPSNMTSLGCLVVIP